MKHLSHAIMAVCLATLVTTVSAADDPANEFGIKLGTSYAKARSRLLAEGWKLDGERVAASSHPGSAYKQFPEIICGNGYDAICTGRFVRAGEALLLTVDQGKKSLLVTSIEQD